MSRKLFAWPYSVIERGISCSVYKAVHYVDPVDGSDLTQDDTRIDTPRRTWPKVFISKHAYLGKGGTTAPITRPINITNDCVVIGSYGEGLHKIEGSLCPDTNRLIRVAADNVVIERIIIEPGQQVGKGHGIQSITGITGGVIRFNKFVGGVRDTNSKAINWQGGAPFYIRNNNISGFTSGVWLNSVAGTYSVINHNVIALTPHENQHSDSAAVAVTGGVDWDNLLSIYDNNLSGWSENAIDLVGGSRVDVYHNECHNPSYSPAGHVAIMCGKATGSAFGNRIFSNHIHDIRATGETGKGTGIGTRGGMNVISNGNLIVNCDWGIAVSSISDNCVFSNETVLGCDVAVNNGVNAGATVINRSILRGNNKTFSVRNGGISYSECFIEGGSVDEGTDAGLNYVVN
jgi:hypothetical protein